METDFDFIFLARFGIDNCGGRGGAPNVHTLFLFAVDKHLKMSAALHVQNVFAGIFGRESGGVFRRKIFDFYVGRKYVHTGSSYLYRIGVKLCGNGSSAVFDVVPKSAFQTFFAVGGALGGDAAVKNLVVCEVAAGVIDDVFLFGADAFEDVDSGIWHTVVIAPHHRSIVGVRANDSNLLGVLFEREDVAVVLEEDNALTSHFECEVAVLLAGEF